MLTYQLVAQVVEEVPLALEALIELPEYLKLVVHVDCYLIVIELFNRLVLNRAPDDAAKSLFPTTETVMGNCDFARSES